MLRLVVVAALCIIAAAWTHGCPTCSVIEVPGPSQNLFNHPWYTCTRNFYVSTTGLDTNPGTLLLPWLTIQNADTQTVTPLTGGDCVNVEPGLYAQGSAILLHGGTGPTASGYVTYRCTMMDACHVQSTSTGFVFFFGDSGSFVILDGFEIDGTVSSSAPDGFVAVCAGTTDNLGGNPVNANTSGESAHHIWVMNSVIHDCNEAGTAFNNKEWYYVIHNQIYHNAYVNTSNGSGTSYNVFNCIEGTLDVNCYTAGLVNGINGSSYTSISGRDFNYVPSGNDTASYNPTLGRYAPFHIVTAWNLEYNNRINAFNYTGNPSSPNTCPGMPSMPTPGDSGGHTDGNGIIMDSGITGPAGEANFTGSMSGSNILNVSMMIGTPPIVPNMVITATSSFGAVLWNSRVQAYHTSGTTGTGGTGTYALSGGSQTVMSQNLVGDFNFPYQTLVLGNLSFYNGGRGVVVLNAGHVLVANNSTFNNSTDTCLAKSETLVAELISNFGYDNTWINNIGFPVQTVYNNTCGVDLFDHYPGAPVNFYNNNISPQDPTTYVSPFSGGVCISNDDSMYWSNSNNKIQDPLWANVSAGLLALIGTDLPTGGTWQPGNSNYALKPSSPAIGYFASSPYVPSWLTDAGACQHTVSVCGFTGIPANY